MFTAFYCDSADIIVCMDSFENKHVNNVIVLFLKCTSALLTFAGTSLVIFLTGNTDNIIFAPHTQKPKTRTCSFTALTTSASCIRENDVPCLRCRGKFKVLDKSRCRRNPIPTSGRKSAARRSFFKRP